MEGRGFSAGERLWLCGHPVTFVNYHTYASSRIKVALVRRQNEAQVRVVVAAKLARDRAKSLDLEATIPAS